MRRQHRMAIRISHLRRYRKHAHLTQRELAYLVGLGGQSIISEIEQGLKHPSLIVEACCEVTFASPLQDLYPALYAKAENEVFERALILLAKLEPLQDRESAVQYLAALTTRLNGDHNIIL